MEVERIWRGSEHIRNLPVNRRKRKPIRKNTQRKEKEDLLGFASEEQALTEKMRNENNRSLNSIH